MADELTKALLVEEAVPPSAIAEALFASVTRGVPLVSALVDAGAATSDVLARYLARSDAPVLRQVVPVLDLAERLPEGLCARLMAVPVRRDAITGTVDVAVADAGDPHPAAELSFHLGAPVRVVRAPIASIAEALRRLANRSVPPPMSSRRLSRPPAPSFFPEEDPLYDSRPRSLPPPVTASARMNTLPPPVFERAPVSAPPAAPRIPQPAAATRRKTPPWGTPVRVPPPPRRDSDSPRSNLGSEIPIPLTRKTFTVERGGTQRPPPLLDAPRERQLGEGIPVDVASFRTVVEVRSPSSSIPKAPRLPASDVTAGGQELGPRVDVGGVLAAMRVAVSRDEILDLVLAGARMLARRIALFVVKRGGYLGWSCTPELGDRHALQGVLVPLESDSVFDAAVKEGLYLGPIRHDDVHASLHNVMRTSSRDVAVVPIRVVGKTAVVVLADDLGDTMIATRRLEEIARAAGDAFARILKTRR